MNRRHRPGWGALLSGALLVILLAASPLPAQFVPKTDAAGSITSDNWLVLGPFSEPFGCNGDDTSILGNHIGPSCIGCQFPEEGDEIDYQPASSVTKAYVGPPGDGGGPVWRRFGDGFDDGYVDLNADVRGSLTQVMSWLVTYVEYTGEGTAIVDLCIGSDDGVQVWLDDRMIHSNNACRGAAPCQDSAPVVLEKGMHRIAIGVWENGGGWGCYLGMKLNGAPIVDDVDPSTFPEFVFHGREGGKVLKETFGGCECPPGAPPAPCRVTQIRCNVNAAEGADLTWINPPQANPAEPIRVHVNGKLVATLGGDAQAYSVESSDIPTSAPCEPSLCVTGGCGLPTCCSLSQTDSGGYIRSSQWLVLGPFQESLACTNNESILANHIAPSTIACQYPQAGDEIEYEPAPVSVTTGYLGVLGPGGGPMWRRFDDGTDDADQDLDADSGGDKSLVMSWLASYVENATDEPIDVTLCVGSDDGVQVWLNDVVVHNNNACRGRALCQDLVAATLQPGITRICMGIWENGGGWGGSLGLRRADGTTPLEPCARDIRFRGMRRPAALGNPCSFRFTRDVPDTLINGAAGVITLVLVPEEGEKTVVIEETPPAGLVPSSPSNGGTVAGDTVTWNLGKVSTRMVLTYTVTVDPDAVDASFSSHATADGQTFLVSGDTRYTGSPITDRGFIKMWNHLGPLAWAFPAVAGDDGPPGACDAKNGADLRVDWIASADGSVTEKTILPFPGLIVRPKYGGTGLPGGGARAAGLTIEPGAAGKVVRDRFPVWKGSTGPTDTIDHRASYVSGFDANDQLTMSAVYVNNHTGAPITTAIGLGSDDSIQVLVNGKDGTAGGIATCRNWGAAGEEQNVIPGVKLDPGENLILVKVIDGSSESGFRLRLRKDPGDPTRGGLVPPDVTYSLESERNPAPGTVVRDIVQETYPAGGAVDVRLAASMRSAIDVTVRETLPDGVTATDISAGGTQTGSVIEWTLAAAKDVVLSYRVVPPACTDRLEIGKGATFLAGDAEVPVTGDTVTRRKVTDGPFSPWDSRDIGPANGAVEAVAPDAANVLGAGAGLDGRADEFRFVSVPASGDFELSARIDCLVNPGGTGYGGLMVRASFDPDAPMVFLGIGPGAGAGALRASYRRDTGIGAGAIPLSATDRQVASLPVYLKLARVGDRLSLQRSADGADYRQVAFRDIGSGSSNKIDLPQDVKVGLAVSSTGAADLTRVDFRQIEAPVGPPRAFFRRGDADGSGRTDVTDAIDILAYLFYGGVTLTCLDAADVTDSGRIDLTDAIALLGFLFQGDGPPPAPGPFACGPDNTPSNITAPCVYAKCP